MLKRLADDLRALQAADQLRDLTIPAGMQLGSNDYLGLSTHPEIKAAIRGALDENGRVCSTGSRLLSGNHERWEQLEAEFAKFVGAEAALYFPSGYAANIGLLSSILQPEDTAGEKFIVVESIFSMDGDRASVDELLALCERYGAWLIVDEAHSTGVDKPIRRTDRLLATVHTCGKALASMGAFVAGSSTLCDFLINHARTFIFTTALPPYCAAHVHAGIALAREADGRRKHLLELSVHMRKRMKMLGFDIGRSDSQIVPLVLGSNETTLRFAKALSSSGFAVSAIRPPSVPVGTARLRLSLNTNLSFTDIDSFLDALIETRDTELVRE